MQERRAWLNHASVQHLLKIRVPQDPHCPVWAPVRLIVADVPVACNHVHFLLLS